MPPTRRLIPVVLMAAWVTAACGEVLIDMPPPPSAPPLGAEGGPTGRVDVGRVALARYVGARRGPAYTYHAVGRPSRRSYGGYPYGYGWGWPWWWGRGSFLFFGW